MRLETKDLDWKQSIFVSKPVRPSMAPTDPFIISEKNQRMQNTKTMLLHVNSKQRTRTAVTKNRPGRGRQIRPVLRTPD